MSLNFEEFASELKELISLQQKMKEIASEAKQKRDPLKARLTELEADVKTYMRSENLDVCKCMDHKIEVQTVERYGSLTQKTLLAALTEYFGKDTIVAEECFNFIRNKLGKKEVDILRRTKIRAPAKRKAAAKPKAAPKKAKTEATVDEEEEEDIPEEEEEVEEEEEEENEDEDDTADDFKL